MDVKQILSWVIPDADNCRRAAEELRLANPNMTAEQHARQAVKDARKWAASVGAATGAVASPLTMFPAAIADAAAMLKLEGKLAGTVAALLDAESLNDPDAFRRDIIFNVFPGAVSQLIRRMGVRASEEAMKNFLRRTLTREASKEMVERSAKMLGIRLTEKALATKAVPLVGAGIGAAWNWVEIQTVGNRAVNYHLGLEMPETRVRKKVTAFVRDQVKKLPRQRP